MEPKNIEQLLKNAKFKHLSEETLVSYRDSQLDELGLALADAHLELCVICEQRLDFLKEEAEALQSYEVTEEDRVSIREIVRKLEPQTKATDYIQTEIQRLRSHIENLLVAWITPFSQPVRRGASHGDVIWRYQSKDGLLRAWAVLEQKSASLIVHFSSPELAWEGARIRFRLGPFSKEVTLQREEDSGVAARIEIPARQRARNMADISIEVV
jgi:hypothetical protein